MKRVWVKLAIFLTVMALFAGYLACAEPATSPNLWTEFTTPQAGQPGMVIDNNLTSPGPIAQPKLLAQSSDGKTLYAYVLAGGTHMLIKSTNDGHTWAPSGTVGQPPTPVFAIAASPTEPNVVYYATIGTVYKSVDAGATFVAEANAPPGNGISALAVAQLSGRYIVVIGTNDGPGNVYYLDESLPFYNFVLLGTNSFSEAVVAAGGGPVSLVSAVALSPNFATDRAVVAIGTDGASTYIMVNILGGAWSASLGRGLVVGGAAFADIAFPADFNIATNPNFYFCASGVSAPGVYRFLGAPAPALSIVNLLNSGEYISLDVAGPFLTASILVGSTASTVVRSTDAGANWAGTVTKQPTGDGTQNVYVLYKRGNPALAYALVRAGAAGDESAFNLSHNGGLTWNQVALINSLVHIHNLAVPAGGELFMASDNVANVTDHIWRFFGGYWERVWLIYGMSYSILQTSPNYPTDGAVFYTQYDSAAALMRSTNFGDTFAPQMSAPGSTVGAANVVHSLAVVDANTVIIGSTGGVIARTTNNGFIWSEATTDLGNITSLRLAPNGDVIAGGAGTPEGARVGRSRDGGASFTTTGVSVFGTIDFIYTAPAADYATSGVIYIANRALSSTSSGIYWGTIPASSATAPVWTRADADPDWYQSVGITPDLAAAGSYVTPDTGLVAAPGGPGFGDEGAGMVYAGSARQITTPGFPPGDYPDFPALARVKGRVATTATSRAEYVPGPVTAGVEIAPVGLWLAPGAGAGSVTLYTIGINHPWGAPPPLDVIRLYTYTETLNKAETGVTVTNVTTTNSCTTCPVGGEATATVKWDAVTGANYYLAVVADTRYTSFYDAVRDISLDTGMRGATITGDTSWNVVSLPADATTYVSVWGFKYTGIGALTGAPDVKALAILNAATANTPRAVSSFGMGQAIIAPPARPLGLAPAPAAVGQPTTPVFQWGAVPNATSYKLQVADNAGFNSPLVDVTVNGTSYIYAGAPLKNNTAYFWRVAAVTASGQSAWTANVFTTAAAPNTQPITLTAPTQPAPGITVSVPTIQAPAVTLPPITVNYPTPVVTRPSGTTVTESPVVTLPAQGTPGYVWVVVAVGLVLVAAVVILVVRTRRVV